MVDRGAVKGEGKRIGVSRVAQPVLLFLGKKLANSRLHKTPWRNQWFARQGDQHIITTNLIISDQAVPAKSASMFIAGKFGTALFSSLFCLGDQVGRGSSSEWNRECVWHGVLRSAEPSCYLFPVPAQMVSTPPRRYVPPRYVSPSSAENLGDKPLRSVLGCAQLIP
jgi:hypothetical protein